MYFTEPISSPLSDSVSSEYDLEILAVDDAHPTDNRIIKIIRILLSTNRFLKMHNAADQGWPLGRPTASAF
jgi:hypothetical protein